MRLLIGYRPTGGQSGADGSTLKAHPVDKTRDSDKKKQAPDWWIVFFSFPSAVEFEVDEWRRSGRLGAPSCRLFSAVRLVLFTKSWRGHTLFPFLFFSCVCVCVCVCACVSLFLIPGGDAFAVFY